MHEDLQNELALSMYRFKKIGFPPPSQSMSGLNVGEVFAMNLISDNISDSLGHEIDIVTEIHNALLISKPAISQMFNSLEKKGYITREINKNNRRKLILTVTPKGKEALDAMRSHVFQMSEQIITRFGEDNMRQFIRLLNRLADISDELREGYNEKGKEFINNRSH